MGSQRIILPNHQQVQAAGPQLAIEGDFTLDALTVEAFNDLLKKKHCKRRADRRQSSNVVCKQRRL
jgi:hypothetical protein